MPSIFPMVPGHEIVGKVEDRRQPTEAADDSAIPTRGNTRHADPALERFGERGLRVAADALCDLGDAGRARLDSKTSRRNASVLGERRLLLFGFVRKSEAKPGAQARGVTVEDMHLAAVLTDLTPGRFDMTPAAQARWARAKRKPGRPRRGKGAKVISVSVERDLLSRSDALAKDLGLSRTGLIERGLKAVLAAQGRD
jgi:hypothetical protein